MSEFFREVDEDYRRERLANIWTKYQVWFIGAAVLLVAATAGWRIYQHFHLQAAEAAGARYEAALRLSQDGKSAEAEAGFKEIAASGPKGYATLARLRGVDEIAGRDPAAAIAAYDALGADPSFDQSFREAAQTRAAMLRVDRDDPKAFEEKYGALAQPSFTYHDTMRELLAMAAFKRDDFEAAGRWLDMIVGDPRAPGPLRQRAEAFLGLVQAGKLAPAPAAESLPAAAPALEAPVSPEAPAAASAAPDEPAAPAAQNPVAEAPPAAAAGSDENSASKSAAPPPEPEKSGVEPDAASPAAAPGAPTQPN
ncbi:tetratricopeptide repeat protein [Methylocella silvestris]|uniref:tetratricopeptide repeat protein n=1 Tax=Methylocella silvestris TaxID=199596 RepID=UPI0015E061F2|nr:tetratricopeptide repeat protein [Methylocella silvestris]